MLNKMAARRKIWIKLLFALLLIILAFLVYFALVAIDHPPEVQDLSALQTEREKIGVNTYILGNNWLRKSESGLWEMYIEGDPFERGVAFGKLTQELLYYQETAFVEQIRELVPSPGYLKFLRYFIAWFDRNLDKNITNEYKTEIYGTSFSCSPEYDFIGSGYQRQLHYHAAHDIGHALKGLNMVGCTSFSCWNDKSADSTLLIGRNFDFYAGNKFAENKIVCFYKPSKGYKFMMVSWADMIGVVSGMNEKGLTITLNAAKSAIPGQASTPVTLLAREILQYATTLDEAYNIARKRKLFVSESLLVGSAKDRKSAIIEKSPHQYDIVYTSASHIVCSNHFQGTVFATDKSNIQNIQGSDSQYRFDRINELLQQDDKIDVSDAVSILRNQLGRGDTRLGMGNPLAVNQLIAHHAVVFKPVKQLVWVSTSPYQLGKFVAYDLDKIFSLKKEQIRGDQEIYTGTLTIPEDTFLYSAAYKDFIKYLEMTAKLKALTREGNPLPPSFENLYIQTNPQLYLTYYHLGEYFHEMKDYKKAYAFYQAALSKEVAGMDQRNKLLKLSGKTLKKISHAHTGN
jgi:isopenicillin-N N-acyltransferase-like protein